MLDVLFTPTKLGSIELKNRIVMAPMTRSRAGEDDAPNDIMVEYYTQRSSAGLIITEGVHPSANGKGYCRTPGIYNQAQIDGWKAVVDSVKQQGGKMVLQMMHAGRVGSKHNKAAGSETVAPSAIQLEDEIYTDSHGLTNHDMPRALETDEIEGVINEYRQATINSFEAGFAGVELHATSGYLPVEFLSTGTNQRTDKYGGSVENRIRFVVEVLEAMSDVAGADKIGMRICPGNTFNNLTDENPEETFTELLKAIDGMGLAYLHVIRMPVEETGVDNIALAKKHFNGPLIFNESYEAEEAATAIQSEGAAAVSFGRHYVANPDLVAKFQSGKTVQEFNIDTLYTPGAEGYTDY